MARDTPREPFQATREALAAELGSVDGVLPGCVRVRRMRCGKASCACRGDPEALHGPYIQWTRTEGGKTVTRYLTPAQLERWRPWFDNARRVKDVLARLEIASVAAVEQAAAIDDARG
jgi:hypothetical protein